MNSREPISVAPPDEPAADGAELLEPRCAAMTRSGQHCRNRPLPGQSYCRVHSAQAAEVADAAAAPSLAPTPDPIPIPEVASEPVAEPEPVAEVTPAVEPVTEVAPAAEVVPVVEPVAAPEPAAEVTPVVEPVAAPEPEAEPEPAVEPAAAPEPVVALLSVEPEAEPEPAAAPEPAAEVEPVAAPEPAVERVAEVEPEPVAAAEVDVEVTNQALPRSTREEVAAAIEELELEIRNYATSTSDMRNLAADLMGLIRENLLRMTPSSLQHSVQIIRENLTGDFFDPDFWRGIGIVLRYQLDSIGDLVRRRIAGDYTTDPYGLDMDVLDAVRPVLQFMYRSWWRVTAEGVEHVPESGRALMVSNHSGVLPWDGAMIGAALFEAHPSPRLARCLHLSWFSTLPLVAPLLAACGQVQALPENALRLLESEELVCVFPEGLKGVGKLYRDRYKLARFGRGGFVQAALRTSAPLIPVSVIGAEETYPMLANAKPLAQLLGLPYFPITPLFPWFGLLGAIPLPSKWTIVFHEPIATDGYGPDGADDPLLVSELTEQVRRRIQATIDARLAARRSVFLG